MTQSNQWVIPLSGRPRYKVTRVLPSFGYQVHILRPSGGEKALHQSTVPGERGKERTDSSLWQVHHFCPKQIIHNLTSFSSRSSDSEGSGHEGVMNPSFTNDNVMFLGRKDFNTSTPKRASSFKSPIDATTQLWTLERLLASACELESHPVIVLQGKLACNECLALLRSLNAHMIMLGIYKIGKWLHSSWSHSLPLLKAFLPVRRPHILLVVPTVNIQTIGCFHNLVWLKADQGYCWPMWKLSLGYSPTQILTNTDIHQHRQSLTQTLTNTDFY